MRLYVIFILCICFLKATAQSPDETVVYLRPRILALDNSIVAAQKFNEEISRAAVDYKLTFVDEESRPLIRYIYKTDNGETMRIDYKYILEGDAEKKIPKRAVVVFQRISAELIIITYVYNFIFNTNYSPDRVMAEATLGSELQYRGRKYQFTLQADDYNPGYWVMTFVR